MNQAGGSGVLHRMERRAIVWGMSLSNKRVVRCARPHTLPLRGSATIRTIAVPAAKQAHMSLTAAEFWKDIKKENCYASSLHAAASRRGRQGRIRRRRIQR